MGGPRRSEVDLRERIIEAAYSCVSRWGIAKTTVEDAAREAGVSRATVYRYFPGGREELVGAVISWEQLRFFARLYEEVRDAGSLEAVMERGLAFARRAIENHEVLQRVLQTEPELLLPKLTVDAAKVVDLVAGFLAPYLEKEDRVGAPDTRRAADFLARMVLSYISSPGRYDLANPAEVADLVRTELLAGILGPQTGS
jgi:AcrR family transcriptional regulator